MEWGQEQGPSQGALWEPHGMCRERARLGPGTLSWESERNRPPFSRPEEKTASVPRHVGPRQPRPADLDHGLPDVSRRRCASLEMNIPQNPRCGSPGPAGGSRIRPHNTAACPDPCDVLRACPSHVDPKCVFGACWVGHGPVDRTTV